MNNPYVKLESAPNPYISQGMGKVLRNQFEQLKIRNAAMTWSAATGTPVIESAAEFINEDPYKAVAKARAAILDDYQTASDDLANDLLKNPADGGELLAEKAAVDAERSQAIAATDDEALFVNETASPNIGDDIRQRMIIQDRAVSAAMNDLSDISFIEKALNIGEFMLPGFGSTSVDFADAANKLKDELGIEDDAGFFSTKSDLIRMKYKYNMMSPEKQEAVLALLKESALDASDGNEAMASLFITEFMKPISLTTGEYLDKAFVGFDIATIGAAAAIKVSKLAKNANAISRANNLGKTEDAADLAVVASQDEKVAKTLGVTQEEAAYTMQPMKLDDFLSYLPDDISAESNATLALMEEVRQERIISKTLLEKQILDERVSDLSTRVKIENTTFKPRTDELNPSTMDIKYVTPDGETEVITLSHLGVDEMGNFKTAPRGWFGKLVFGAKDLLVSPVTKYLPDVNRLVNLPTNAKNIEARMGALYAKAQKQHQKTVKKLSKQEQKQYDDLIKTGAIDGKEYTDIQLKEMGIDDAVRNAYYEQRGMASYAWYIKATDRLEQFKMQGYTVTVPITGQYHGLGKVAENPMAMLREAEVPEVFNLVDNTPVKVADITADTFNDYKLVKFSDAIDVPGKENGAYRYVLVKDDNIRPMIHSDVLPRLPGYVPKIHENANYFVTMPIKGRVNGQEGTKYLVTDRAFSTKQKADAYVLGKYGSLDEAQEAGVVIRFDREYDAVKAAGESRAYNGLFTGKRKRDGLLVDNKPDEYTLGHQEAMGHYYQNLASQGLYEPVKRELQNTWLKTYKDILPAGYHGNFKDAINELAVHDPSRAQVARSQHEYISFLSNFRTERDIRIGRLMRSLSESNGWLNKAYTKMYKEKGTVSGKAKELQFHLNLGLLNPSQFLVQGSGSFISFGAHPVAFTKMMPSILNMIKAETSGVIPMPKTNVARLWTRSGFSEGVSMQADVMEMLQKHSSIGNVSSYFFTMGEKLNRISAFNTAYEVLRSKKGVKALTEADLPELMNMTNNLTLNFSAVNKAKWQNGWLGVITQFQQVWEKSMNQVFNPFMKGPLTAQERLGAAGTQAMLFGMMGLPISFAYKYVDEMAAKQGWPEEVTTAIRRGLDGNLPVQNSFGSRMALGNVLTNFWIDIALGNASLQPDILSNLRKGMLGVTGASLARMGESILKFDLAKESGDADTMLRMLGQGVTENFSTGRNIYNAVWLYDQYNQIRTSTGTVQWEGDLSTLEQILLGLGFNLKEVQDAYYLKGVADGQDRFLSQLAKRMVAVFGPDPDKFDLNSISTYDPELGSLGPVVKSLDPWEKMKLKELIDKQLKENPTFVEKVGKSFEKEFRPILTTKVGEE